MRVLIFVSLFISLNLHAKSSCLEFPYQSKNLTVKLKEKAVTISFGEFSSVFSCKQKDGIYHCSGDDDSGNFTLNTKINLLRIEHISFGEPDGRSLQLSKKVLTGKSCTI